MHSMLSSIAVNEADQATRSMLQVEDYWGVDAMMTYPISDNINLQLNFYSPTDEDYISTVNEQKSPVFLDSKHDM